MQRENFFTNSQYFYSLSSVIVGILSALTTTKPQQNCKYFDHRNFEQINDEELDFILFYCIQLTHFLVEEKPIGIGMEFYLDAAVTVTGVQEFLVYTVVQDSLLVDFILVPIMRSKSKWIHTCSCQVRERKMSQSELQLPQF